MPKINRDWHLAHPMPPKATLDQRVDWHLEHLKHCRCRTDLLKTIVGALRERGIPLPPEATPPKQT